MRMKHEVITVPVIHDSQWINSATYHIEIRDRRYIKKQNIKGLLLNTDHIGNFNDVIIKLIDDGCRCITGRWNMKYAGINFKSFSIYIMFPTKREQIKFKLSL